MKLFGIKEYLLPPPSKIWSEFLKRHPTVFAAAWVTTTEIIGGYLLAVVVSIPLALAVVRWRFVEESVYPLVVFLQIIPKIAIAPLFIIWFGFGLFPKLLIVFLLCFFPIVVASVAGFKAVDPDVMDFARSTGASGMRMFLKIRLPQALPDIFTGSRSARALGDGRRGGRVRGLRPGPRLPAPAIQRPARDADGFAIIVLLSLIGLTVYYAVETLERLVIPWHVSQRPATSRGSERTNHQGAGKGVDLWEERTMRRDGGSSGRCSRWRHCPSSEAIAHGRRMRCRCA